MPRDCDALARELRDDDDGLVFAIACSEHELDRMTATAALRRVRTLAQARMLLRRVEAHPDLRGLATLLARAAPRTVPPDVLPSAAETSMTPIDERVLQGTALAYRQAWEPGVPHEQRTRARAWLAKVYLRAIRQMGLSPEAPVQPAARLLAGSAFEHAEAFAVGFWQRRISGFFPLFSQTEEELAELVGAVESGPHHADPALTSWGLARARSYLGRSGLQSRIGVVELAGPHQELRRLLVHRLDDAALQEARRALSNGELDPARLAPWMAQTLAHLDREPAWSDLGDRLPQARPAPDSAADEDAEPSQSDATPLPDPWPDADREADDIVARLQSLPEDPFPRRVAWARILLRLGDRPDVLRVLIARATRTDAPSVSRDHGELWSRLLRAADDGSERWLEPRIELDRVLGPTDSEADRRRRFAHAAARHDPRD